MRARILRFVPAVAVCLAAVFPARPSAAGSGGEEPAASLSSALLRPADPRRSDATPRAVILGETERDRRRFVIALPVGAGAKAAPSAAREGIRRAHASYVARKERVHEWASRELLETEDVSEVGAIALTQLSSALEVSCPRRVPAGQPIVVTLKSVGTADAEWHVSLVYPTCGDRLRLPDGGRYETETLQVGDRVGGEERVHTVRFRTYPADRGRMLGVRIERSARAEDGATLWLALQ
jgi:hypothetical protein